MFATMFTRPELASLAEIGISFELSFCFAEYWTVFQCDLNFVSNADGNLWKFLFDFYNQNLMLISKKIFFVKTEQYLTVKLII